MTEAELQKAVLELAKRFGWRSAHFTTSQVKPGVYATAVAGDGKGFPDLVLVRPPRLIFAELKTRTNRLSAEQKDWIAALEDVRDNFAWPTDQWPGDVDVQVWNDLDWDSGEIERMLR